MPEQHSTITRTVAGETDKRIIVKHPLPLARTMSIGNNWTKLRLGIRLSTRRTIAWTSPPPLFMGLSSGTQDLPGSRFPKHFVGLRFYQSWVNSTTYFTTSTGTVTHYQMQKYENGLSTRVGIVDSGFNYIMKHLSGRSGLFIEFERWPGSTIHMWAYGRHNSPFTLQNYKDALSSGSVSTYANAITGTNAVAIAETVNEATFGPLDTVCFSWLGYGDDNAFEVSDIDYAVLA